jgi:hypothetical protein
MKKYIPLLMLAGYAFSCANDSDPAADKSNFARVYNSNTYNASYYPIDITQTPDGGYLILGGRTLEGSDFSQTSDFSGTYLLKVDEFGGFVSEQEVSSESVAPTGPLLSANDKYYFFCMTPVGLGLQLTELTASGEISQTIDVGGSYPVAAAQDNTNFILLSYDNEKKQSVVSVVSPTGSVSNSKGYPVSQGDAAAGPIVNHFINNDAKFPFQVGKTSSGQYFFNGFYNDTFSFVVTDLSADTPNGVVYGQQDKGGFSQVVPLSGDTYAAARFNFGDNYLLPAATLKSSGVGNVTDDNLNGNYFPELSPNAPVRIVVAPVNGKDVILYGSNTRSKQIALFGYDRTSGVLVGSRYLGFSNPFEIASIAKTKDGGIVVCGTTYVAGRFPRICIFKISSSELGDSFGH